MYQNKDKQWQDYHLRFSKAALSKHGSLLSAFRVSFFLWWLGCYLRFSKAVISMVRCPLQISWSRQLLGGGNQWFWYFLDLMIALFSVLSFLEAFWSEYSCNDDLRMWYSMGAATILKLAFIWLFFFLLCDLELV